MNKGDTDSGDECSCGTISYQGGYCFNCGKYRASKHNKHRNDMDLVDFMQLTMGMRVDSSIELDADYWNDVS